MILAQGVCAGDFNPTNASMETLVGWAQRYGSTPEKKRNREAARAELFARGGESLRFLLGNVHLTNDMVRILIDDMVRVKLPATNAAPVLAEFLAAPEPVTRRVSAYYLGFTSATNYSPQVLPLLADELAAGAAARTLGKWQVREARAEIEALLASDKEPRRVIAVNALRDIGDPACVPALVGTLGDKAFTVRKAAARALATLGAPAEEALVAALAGSSGTAQREIVRTLGAMGAQRAAEPLQELLVLSAGGLRADVEAALAGIGASDP